MPGLGVAAVYGLGLLASAKPSAPIFRMFLTGATAQGSARPLTALNGIGNRTVLTGRRT